MRTKSMRWLTLSAKATGVAACVGAILHGAAYAADGNLEDIVVTASRRSETVSKAPYNISAYNSEQLQAGNITSVTALSQQVPNFVVQDTGAKNSASQIPIIRGLNASAASGLFDQPRIFQSPVGLYLGNTPMLGSLPLIDVERVEVLRGPQGTLYGAGTLAGAVRVVPVEPKLNDTSGFVSAAGAVVSHSNSNDYDASGAVNLPLGSTAAVRLVAKYEYDAGYIDQYGIMRREGNNYASGVPVLANPSDPAGSPAVYFNKKDVNYTATTSTRATLHWEPTDTFKLNATYSYAHLNGNGSPKDNHTYTGGASPVDPSYTLPATGEYEIALASLEPFNRTTHLASVDPSLDLGFATLSGTLSYGQTDGWNVFDGTANLVGNSVYGPYYTGIPANPRTVIPYGNGDHERTYTEELRLVSNGKNTVDYVVGLYSEQQKRQLVWQVYVPGGGVPAAYLGPDFKSIDQNAEQNYKEYSAYGNLTWNLTDRWQVTGGARFFHEQFTQHEIQTLYLFGLNSDTSNANSVSNHIFMLNTSYELSPTLKTYATWSQGFRRGGANTYQISGPLAESPSLITYRPDKTNNFEAGIKGRAAGLYLSAAVFYIDWKDPQIDLFTPALQYPAVVNGKGATSKGLELEASGPLGIDGFTFNAGFAYAHARLSEDFALPAATGDGTGSFDPQGIVGKSGDRLPGAPDVSAALNVNYSTSTQGGSKVTVTLGGDYRSSTTNLLPNINPNTPMTTTPAYTMLHGDIEMSTGAWRYTLYATNLLDKYVVYSKASRTLDNVATIGGYGDTYAVARPREIGLRLTRDF
jgi:iron complex outermembrane recepter protein